MPSCNTSFRLGSFHVQGYSVKTTVPRVVIFDKIDERQEEMSITLYRFIRCDRVYAWCFPNVEHRIDHIERIEQLSKSICLVSISNCDTIKWSLR